MLGHHAALSRCTVRVSPAGALHQPRSGNFAVSRSNYRSRWAVRSTQLSEAATIALREGEQCPLQGDGIYAVYNEEKQLQYIGMSRQVAASLAGHVADLPDRAVYARVRPVPGGGKVQLQAAWKEWVVQHGSVPPGNAKGVTDWTTRKAAGASSNTGPAAAAAAAAPARPTPDALRAKRARCADARASALITPDVLHTLLTRGWVVLDGAVGEEQIAAARAGAEALRAAGCMTPVSQQRGQGREDEILVMDEAGGGTRVVVRGGTGSTPAAQQLLAGSECAGLAAVGSLMKGLPHALTQQYEQYTKAAAGRSSGSTWAMPELAVPESLMLATYPGAGAYYAVHRDNDTPADETAPPLGGGGAAWAGPPGQRVRDRAVTALLYLNPSDWSPEQDGGCLRVYEPDGSGTYADLAPVCGRMVIFQSRAIDHEVLPAHRGRWALSAWVPALAAFSQ